MHTLTSDTLGNYSCTGCTWAYAHVGSGEPDKVAKAWFDVDHEHTR